MQIDITGSLGCRKNYPGPFRVGKRPAVGLAEFSRTIGVAVKHSDDWLPVLRGQRTNSSHFNIRNGKTSNLPSAVKGGQHPRNRKPPAIAVTEQHPAAFARFRRIKETPQLGTMLYRDYDFDLGHSKVLRREADCIAKSTW